MVRPTECVIGFPDRLVQKIVLSSQCRPQLTKVFTARSVWVSAESTDSGSVTVSAAGSSGNTAAAIEDIVTLARSAVQSITIEPLTLHCCNIPILASDSIVQEIQKIDAQYGIDISVVTTSGERVKFSDFVTQIRSQMSGSDNSLLLSQVSRFAEMKLSYIWRYKDNSGQMRTFPTALNAILNEKYYPFRCGIFSFMFDSLQYEIDFSRMTLTQQGSAVEGAVDREPPSWTYSDTASLGGAHKFSRCFDEVTSQEIEIAVQCGVPGLLKLGECHVSFDTNSNPVVLYDVSSGSKWFLRRKPSLPESRDSLITLAIRSRKDDMLQIVQTLKTVLREHVVSESYKIPPSIAAPLQCLMVNMARQFCVQTSVFREDGSSVISIQLEGEREYVRAIKMHLLEECQHKIVSLCVEAPLTIPRQWKPEQKSDAETVPVPCKGEEWNELESLLHQSLPSVKLLEIVRIQNLTLWRRYSFFRSLMSRKNHGQVNEKLLFHGSRATDPKTIISSEKGFDFRYGSDECLWGKGTYFAVKAQYCDGKFAFRTREGTKQVFVARVLTGISAHMPQPNRTLREPPKKPHFTTDNYDSVNGVAGSTPSQVYVIYDHDKAYPAYLLTYK